MSIGMGDIAGSSAFGQVQAMTDSSTNAALQQQQQSQQVSRVTDESRIAQAKASGSLVGTRINTTAGWGIPSKAVYLDGFFFLFAFIKKSI